MSISYIVNNIFYLYYLLLIVRIVLSWIPNIDWNVQPFAFIRSLTDPFLNLFRGIIPPIGGVLDISPIIAFFVFLLLQNVVIRLLVGLGL